MTGYTFAARSDPVDAAAVKMRAVGIKTASRASRSTLAALERRVHPSLARRVNEPRTQ